MDGAVEGTEEGAEDGEIDVLGSSPGICTPYVSKYLSAILSFTESLLAL